MKRRTLPHWTGEIVSRYVRGRRGMTSSSSLRRLIKMIRQPERLMEAVRQMPVDQTQKVSRRLGRWDDDFLAISGGMQRRKRGSCAQLAPRSLRLWFVLDSYLSLSLYFPHDDSRLQCLRRMWRCGEIHVERSFALIVIWPFLL